MENKILLKKTKIGDFLTLGIEIKKNEVGLFLASNDVSSACAFDSKEWRKFADGVIKADCKLKLSQYCKGV